MASLYALACCAVSCRVCVWGGLPVRAFIAGGRQGMRLSIEQTGPDLSLLFWFAVSCQTLPIYGIWGWSLKEVLGLRGVSIIRS